ncbi:MAG: DM13 domain-containing protein [Actinomycetota bacterium]
MATRVRPPEQGNKAAGGRIRSLVRTHPKAVAGLALIVVGLGIFGFLWFRPDKLLVDTTVNDALPSVQAPGATTAPTTGTAPATNVVLSTGRFRDLEHPTSGVAKIVRLADGSRVVRLEDFRTSSGPDVVVWLSSIPATEDDWHAYDDGTFVNLGALKGNVGSQNYTIPANVDIAKYRSVVIWCRRFTVGFGAAPISPTTT